MYFIKKSLWLFTVGILSVVTVVFALDSVSITPATLTVNPWDTIVFSAATSWTVLPPLTYDWFIDSTYIVWFTWSTLSLDWSTYLTYFPADAMTDSSRTVSVQAMDNTPIVVSWSSLLIVEHPVVYTPVWLFWWDNYCGDWNFKISLWEECDDGNGKNWDWCSINCECERWYSCLEDGSIKKISLPVPDPSDDTLGDNDWDGNSDMEDKPWIKDMLADRNRTPLVLWDNTPSNAKIPLDAPSTGASLEQLRMMWVYVKAEKEESVDIINTLPTLTSGHVAKPSYLPMTGWQDTGRPARITVS